MSKLIPDYVFDSIYDITPEVLTAHGVRGVLVDLDGTMASHKAALPPDTLHTFVDRLKDAGIAVLVFLFIWVGVGCFLSGTVFSTGRKKLRQVTEIGRVKY